MTSSLTRHHPAYTPCLLSSFHLVLFFVFALLFLSLTFLSLFSGTIYSLPSPPLINGSSPVPIISLLFWLRFLAVSCLSQDTHYRVSLFHFFLPFLLLLYLISSHSVPCRIYFIISFSPLFIYRTPFLCFCLLFFSVTFFFSLSCVYFMPYLLFVFSFPCYPFSNFFPFLSFV